MRITYIHRYFVLPGEPGGPRPYEFARRVAAAGHEMITICGRDEVMGKTIGGVHVRHLAIPCRDKMSKCERIVNLFNFLVCASTVTACVPANVIYVSSIPLTVVVPGIVAKFTQRASLVTEIRDLWPEASIKLGYLDDPVAIFLVKQLEKAFYATSGEVMALSPSMADGVGEVALKKRVTVIPNVSDFERFNAPVEQRAALRKEQGWGDDIVTIYASDSNMSYQLE